MRGGPCQVYGLDFSSRGLEMLAELPHVGSIIPGDERDRVSRLLRTLLMAAADDRARRYAAVRAGTITEYRRIAASRGRAAHPAPARRLLRVPAAVRDGSTAASGSTRFTALAADGRPLGIHVVLTADRPAALSPRLTSAIQRRLTLRLADDNEYALAGVDEGILTPESPPGRAVMSRAELQVAVLGGSPDITAQARAIVTARGGDAPPAGTAAPPVEQLPELVRLSELPVTGRRPAGGRDGRRQPRHRWLPPGGRLPYVRAARQRSHDRRRHPDHRGRPSRPSAQFTYSSAVSGRR